MGADVRQMNTTSCTTCREALPDLLFELDFQPGPELASHLDACPACRAELAELRATMAMMDAWAAPEPTPYFDARVRAHLREAVAAAPETLWERLAAILRAVPGHGLRPALAGVFLFLLLVGGGASLWEHYSAVTPSSPAVNDLRIFDNNAQAVQQMDLLDDAGTDEGNGVPQS